MPPAILIVLHAFASGGAAMTGVEAISNGVPAFKPPEATNARHTLVVMGALLGTMFIGISWLAASMHVVPSDSQTVLAQTAKAIYGTGPVGHVLFLFTQAATMLILVLAANTSFADFPRLASFHADDAFMPKQLTKRGHRLVFSNGIIALAIAGAIPVIIFQADVTHLIPLYAIGVFTSFTLSQAGMAKKHIKDKEQGWRLGLFVNGLGAVTTGVVTIVIGTFKFTGGAWFIMLLVPIMVFLLVRLNHAYESEKEELEHEAAEAAERPDPALPLGDRADRAARPELGPGHPVRPHAHARRPQGRPHRHRPRAGRRAGRGVDPARPLPPAARAGRLPRPAHHPLRARGGGRGRVADGNTEVSVLIPRREYRRFWHRFLHDHTADSIAKVLTDVPHANVTFVPYHLGKHTPGARLAAEVVGTGSEAVDVFTHPGVEEDGR